MLSSNPLPSDLHHFTKTAKYNNQQSLVTHSYGGRPEKYDKRLRREWKPLVIMCCHVN